MKLLEKLKEVHGEVVKLTTPSGNEVVLRQQNGEDDDILTNGKSVTDGSAMVKFLIRLIVDSTFTEKGTVSYDQASSMRLPDVYFILIASRIFSLGQVLHFTYQWEGEREPHTYEEDLGLYIWDYTKPFPKYPSDPDYNPYRIRPISKELDKELTLSSGKIVKYDYMNPRGERYLMNLPLESQSKNKELMARNIRIKNDEKWEKVNHFKFFSARDMIELRKDVNENDPTLEILTEIEHPNTGQKIMYPILNSMDFFFPREI